jgi:hypothetical protein
MTSGRGADCRGLGSVWDGRFMLCLGLSIDVDSLGVEPHMLVRHQINVLAIDGDRAVLFHHQTGLADGDGQLITGRNVVTLANIGTLVGSDLCAPPCGSDGS